MAGNKVFENTKIDYTKLDENPKYDFGLLYSKSSEELVAQQTKRHQIIAFYLRCFLLLCRFPFYIDKDKEIAEISGENNGNKAYSPHTN